MFHSEQLGNNRLTTANPGLSTGRETSQCFLWDDWWCKREADSFSAASESWFTSHKTVYKLKTTFIQTSFSVYLCRRRLSSSSWSPPAHLLSSLLSCSFVPTTFSSTFSSGCCELSSLFWSLLSRHDRQTERERDRQVRATDRQIRTESSFDTPDLLFFQ